MSDLEKINSIFNAKIDSVKSKDELQNLKTEFFGKNGQITNQFKNLGSLSVEEKKEFASSLNKLKDSLSNQIEKKNLEIETQEINEKFGAKEFLVLTITPKEKITSENTINNILSLKYKIILLLFLSIGFCQNPRARDI